MTGMQVTGVVRVENRVLYNRFNDRLNTLLEREPYVAMVQKHSYKQLLDYLFLIWKPGGCGLLLGNCLLWVWSIPYMETGGVWSIPYMETGGVWSIPYMETGGVWSYMNLQMHRIGHNLYMPRRM